MVGGALGVFFAPLYSLAYFATEAGAADARLPWVRAWAEPARALLGPLVTFASPDVVYLTYGKLLLVILLGLLAGVVGLHARQREQGGRLERWGFRASALGLLLLLVGSVGAYWLGLIDLAFFAFILPGLLLLMVGSSLFGIGTWRAGVAPRAGALLLIAGGFPGAFLIGQIATLGGGLVLIFLAWVVLGRALWSPAAAPSPAVAR